MPTPSTVTINLTYDQICMLDSLLARAISTWAINIEVSDDILATHRKVGMARNEFER